ncbi:MAG: class I SAM-dependent rRNA methyltransferase [Gemmatimonadota bacterium]|nr:class I SAM-dependent rRNA methyltransferase [Gemmatimonadota bacterium]MDH3366773.1 class I SAM-dependent rRNA methyltransferase [Gemmatimonadota bacterium]MDH3479383.1 class I SAM-dependent rRNA methyltransferase [Gemmatimonadota bacterium]MDH3569062.1 class I SAM-dependent rRNA methyltransferase [Gemmatimonadota bacterium]MDH5548895.1 class I SAM-dependent rRNA methyltransferase [Gemmatimonadota bacterium]
MNPTVAVSRRGARRLQGGHPWVYRSDVEDSDLPAGPVHVRDVRGRFLGCGLWSPQSEIRLRLLTSDDVTIDEAWWAERIAQAVARRAHLVPGTTAYRVVHAEGDGLPALVIDRYGEFVVVQLLTAGIEAVRHDVLGAIGSSLQPAGILLRNDASVRRHEGLPLAIEAIDGSVPERVEVRVGTVRYWALLRTGQKTGAFLDQRANQQLMERVALGRALDVFTYQGLFAIHMAHRADSVLAIDSSAPALDVARANAQLNAGGPIEWLEANAFDALRSLDDDAAQFDTIVLDPPAFAKSRNAVSAALRGYKEINLRALRMLAPGGRLLTCSCSYHVSRARFLDMLASAAADSGRRIVLERLVGQSDDHPEVLTVPESSYLKGALVRAD